MIFFRLMSLVVSLLSRLPEGVFFVFVGIYIVLRIVMGKEFTRLLLFVLFWPLILFGITVLFQSLSSIALFGFLYKALLVIYDLLVAGGILWLIVCFTKKTR